MTNKSARRCTGAMAGGPAVVLIALLRTAGGTRVAAPPGPRPGAAVGWPSAAVTDT